MTTELLLSASKKLGLSLDDLAYFTIGGLADYAEYEVESMQESEEGVASRRKATQADFDNF